MRSGSLLINMARGAIVDSKALLAALESDHLGGAILAVWEGEPLIDPQLAHRVTVGLPHIAGYSSDARIGCVQSAYKAACRFLEKQPEWNAHTVLTPPQHPELTLDGTDLRAFTKILIQAYDIQRDERALTELLSLKVDQQAAEFDRLHREYPNRREFHHYTVRIPTEDHPLRQTLQQLGFNISVQE